MSSSIQYTVRGVPKDVDQALRNRARREGKSLNETALGALRRGLGLDGAKRVRHDLDEFIGTWEDDPVIEQALEAQRKIDEELWR